MLTSAVLSAVAIATKTDLFNFEQIFFCPHTHTNTHTCMFASVHNVLRQNTLRSLPVQQAVINRPRTTFRVPEPSQLSSSMSPFWSCL